MSEEILKALMQLFAIVAKQDDGASVSARKFVEEFLYMQLNEDLVLEYLTLYDGFVGPVKPPSETPAPAEGQPVKKRRTSVKDSAITLAICQKINKTLTQKQKVVVLVRLFELIAADRSFTDQRMELLYTVADAFNFDMDEFAIIRQFVTKEVAELSDIPEIMLIDGSNQAVNHSCKHIHSLLDGHIIILRIKSSDLYFLRFNGNSEVFLNGLSINPKRIYLFAGGSIIKVPDGKPVFYSDVISKFLADESSVQLSFNVNQLEYKFPNGKTGLHDIHISEGAGKLIGIMGASGAGKTTLLNVLAGIEKPSSGTVLLNGINIHKDKDKIKSVIGYIPQDDLLLEELTVFENLYYSARLCFKDLSEEELLQLISKTLSSLGLAETAHLKVGSPLDKKISGGQRKRLNIALELIREPSVLFVDEPTSGLSSRDSENVMDLLRELTLKGKLIFVVIHQPSSDIYKMFDKIIFLDVGGYLIYYGNPVEAVTYFKKADMQANANNGDCPVCGNVNPELIFNIIEAKMVDDYGQLTPHRKVAPKKWKEHFEKNNHLEHYPDLNNAPPSKLNLPSLLKQFLVYTQRDFKSKISNQQYLIINLLETPLLAFVLSFIIRYVAKANSTEYVFKDNDNIPAYIFMSIIVMLFVGLTVSAEEIFRDKKILRREALLSLSRSSYLFSKLFILFSLSAIQSLLFVLIGNSIIGIKDMFFDYWLVMFSMSCFANILGLNISATFNSAVTIYILIPLLIIPQMILGGAMFSYQKLNRVIGGGYQVPMIAEVMAARWGYEALMVNQFVNNEYERKIYETERKESIYSYKQGTYLSELKGIVTESKRMLKLTMNDSVKEALRFNLSILQNELNNERTTNKEVTVNESHLKKITVEGFSVELADSLNNYIDALGKFYNSMFTVVSSKKDIIINKMNETPEKEAQTRMLYNNYYNKYLADLVKMSLEANKIVREEGRLVQVLDPVFQVPSQKNALDFRTHFFAPKKPFAGTYYNTLGFNVTVTWLFSLLLYFALYFEWFKKVISFNVFKRKGTDEGAV